MSAAHILRYETTNQHSPARRKMIHASVEGLAAYLFKNQIDAVRIFGRQNISQRLLGIDNHPIAAKTFQFLRFFPSTTGADNMIASEFG